MRLQRDSYAPKKCAFDAANVQFLRVHLCKSHPVLQHQAQFEEFLSGFAKDLWFIRAMRTDADAASCDTKPAAKRACRKAK